MVPWGRVSEGDLEGARAKNLPLKPKSLSKYFPSKSQSFSCFDAVLLSVHGESALALGKDCTRSSSLLGRPSMGTLQMLLQEAMPGQGHSSNSGFSLSSCTTSPPFSHSTSWQPELAAAHHAHEATELRPESPMNADDSSDSGQLFQQLEGLHLHRARPRAASTMH
jgi:hypothetical protein